mmetsp:Transcript_11417/g.28359  ORF Transcript_11417/g.28359 Transcript_11417/m.28359 type:complete len:686 (-) Transcript_11417:498-2555(-)
MGTSTSSLGQCAWVFPFRSSQRSSLGETAKNHDQVAAADLRKVTLDADTSQVALRDAPEPLAESHEEVFPEGMKICPASSHKMECSQRCKDGKLDGFDGVMPTHASGSGLALAPLSQQMQAFGRDWVRMISRTQLLGLFLGLVTYVSFLHIELDERYPKANDMLAVTGLVSSFWVFEVLPLPVTSMLPLVLMPFAEIMTSVTASSAYWGWVQMLFFGAFVVDIAVEHVELHSRIALKVLRVVGVSRPWIVVLAFLVISYFLSMWCSNTATTVMLVPFATGLLDSALQQQSKPQANGSSGPKLEGGKEEAAKLNRFSVGVLLSIAYGASCGGVATLIGTPPNGVLAGLPIVTAAIGSSDWFQFAAPLSVVLVVLVYAAIYLMFIRGVKLELDDTVISKAYQDLGPLNRDEVVVAVIQFLQFAGFLVRKDLVNNPEMGNLIGVNDATIACAAGLMLFFVPSVKRPGEPVLTWEVAQERLPWGVLILMGGGFAIAKGFQTSELTQCIGEKLAEFAGVGRLWLTLFIVGSVCLLTEVTSNTATANIILPILAAVSAETLMHPLALLLPATAACSFAFMLPAATPPNSVVFATGRVKISYFVRAGVCLNALAIALGTLLIYALAGVIYDVDGPFPEWACLPEDCVWVPIPGLVRGQEVSSQACGLIEQDICRILDGTVLNATSLEILDPM